MPVLEIENVSKHFGSLRANDKISLTLAAGEVLALLGENGAGKTTLMNILFGHYVADEGSIRVNGHRLQAGATEAAIRAGVGMVHQHFTLADNMTVLENIMLGTEALWWPSSRVREGRKRLQTLSERFGLDVDPGQRVAELSVGEKQRVEILKVLYRDARILVLDEPTAVLTPQETDALFKTLRSMVSEGLSIIFISHKLREILSISDRVAVLRHGQLVGEIETAGSNKEILAEMMVGRKIVRPDIEYLQKGDPVLQLEAVDIARSEKTTVPISNLSLTVHAREIIGVAGVAGNGQSTLARLLSGLQKPKSGGVFINGEQLKSISADQMKRRGVGRIPEDRHGSGVVGEMSVWENLISEQLRQPPFWRFRRFIDRAACLRHAESLMEEFDIRCDSLSMPIRLLSGGNMQKCILARVLSQKPGFILANQPVRGLDEGAISAVHTFLLAAKKQGAAILLFSEDLDELFQLCDRIAVMYHGQLGDAMQATALSKRQVGAMMAGHDAAKVKIA